MAEREKRTLITNQHSNGPIPSNFHPIPCVAPLIRIRSHTLSPPPPKSHIRRRLHCLLTPAPSAPPRFETSRCGVAAAGFPFSRRRVLLIVALIPSWSCFLSLPRRPTKAVAFASAYTSDCASFLFTVALLPQSPSFSLCFAEYCSFFFC
ncbi:hypothetical protein PIB30_063399 [Stylosanthes scabra]|uniref:Uncharacterized protein n=1 Tax=Stylosanthes scabra TaxID=79078 RepID=A0ABU6QLC9_9FABA|nr:hypothetical protein [Stylosanthes scabra]